MKERENEVQDEQEPQLIELGDASVKTMGNPLGQDFDAGAGYMFFRNAH